MLSNYAPYDFFTAEMRAPNGGIGDYPATTMASRSTVLYITRDYKNETDVQVTVHRDKFI
jgi:hypothetical protein